MGKRSGFERRPYDAYDTIDGKAVRALMPHLTGVRTFAEPCAGQGALVRWLVMEAGLTCVQQSDIQTGTNALCLTSFNGADCIISNPPWTRQLLHPLILHLQKFAPTWLLFDSDWMFNRQAAPFLDQCTDIVAVGRLKWIANTDKHGKDNVAWYRFDANHRGGPRFHNRRQGMNQVSSTAPTEAVPDNALETMKDNDLIRTYLDLRNEKKATDEQYQALAHAKFGEPMQAIEQIMLDRLNKRGSDSIKAKGVGTAFKKQVVSVTTADAREFQRHVIGGELWDLIEFRPSKTAINDLVEKGEPLPPGINRTGTFVVQFRTGS